MDSFKTFWQDPRFFEHKVKTIWGCLGVVLCFLIISLAFLDRGLGSLNKWHFQHNTDLGHSFIVR
jgi:hypothetical protein